MNHSLAQRFFFYIVAGASGSVATILLCRLLGLHF